MEIYLIRHTRVDLQTDTCYGQSNVKLASSFEEESKDILSKLPCLKSFTCYTSPLTRCKTLAEKIPSQEIKTDARLIELNFGDWELKKWNEIGRSNFDKWFADIVHHPVPNGESFLDLHNRSISFWKEIISKNEDFIIITHSGVIHALLAYILDMHLKNSFRIKIDYGSISKVLLKDDFTSIEYVNR